MSPPDLVTGAAGFAGGHMVDLLARHGRRVVAWHRPSKQAPANEAAEWDAVDLLDRSAVRSAVAELRPARIYHCAGAAHVGGAWQNVCATLQVNVLGTHHLLEALRDEGIDASVLVPSSALVYSSASRPLREDDPIVPDSPYGLSKLAQELVGLHAAPGGPRVFIARAFNHLGPRQDPSFVASGFARQIAHIERGLAPAEIQVGNLAARRDLTDVRDTVRAYELILERGVPDRPYNVCTGRAVTIRDLLDLLLARAHVSIRVSVDQARYRPNDLPLVVGDPSRLQNELGWRPEIPLEQTLDDLLAFWRAE